MKARWLAMVATLLALVLAPRPAAAAKPPADKIWTRRGGVGRAIHTIALVPAAEEEPTGGVFVDDQWLVQFYEDGHDWLPAPLVRDQLRRLSTQRDSALRAINAQILRRGRIDSVAVPVLARTLHAQALLTVRVDRWERVKESNPYLTTAYVELTAALVDSTGTLVWRISGEERETARYGIPVTASGLGQTGQPIGKWSKSPSSTADIPNPDAPVQQLRQNPSRLGKPLPPDFDVALRRLLARWGPLFPGSKLTATATSRP